VQKELTVSSSPANENRQKLSSKISRIGFSVFPIFSTICGLILTTDKKVSRIRKCWLFFEKRNTVNFYLKFLICMYIVSIALHICTPPPPANTDGTTCLSLLLVYLSRDSPYLSAWWLAVDSRIVDLWFVDSRAEKSLPAPGSMVVGQRVLFSLAVTAFTSRKYSSSASCCFWA
jgi:hypothetical protein